MKLSERLRDLRKEINKTQKEISIDLGVKESNYNKWENGVEPSLEIICSIANYYGTTIDYLVGVSEERYRNNSDNNEIMRWETLVSEYTNNLLNKFFDKYNKYKKQMINENNALNLGKVFAFTIEGGFGKLMDSHNVFLDFVEKIPDCKNFSKIDNAINKFFEELGDFYVGGYKDSNGAWVNSFSDYAIASELKNEFEKKIDGYKEYRTKTSKERFSYHIRINGLENE